MDSYYKRGQLFYYKVQHGLLQIATDITKCDKFITNFDRYYKLSAMIITNSTVQSVFGFYSYWKMSGVTGYLIVKKKNNVL